jgi:PleD family two-component response regulator
VFGGRSRDDAQRYADLFDPVTRLPRPELVWDRLGMALARAERERRRVGVINVRVAVSPDVDRPRSGRLDLLLLVAGRLRSLVRPDDTVGRLAGDAFVVVCNGLTTEAELDAIAERIRAIVALPIYFDERSAPVSAVVHTQLAAPGADLADLLSAGDTVREVAVTR